jgi:CHAD domain-containing protein
VAYRLTTDESIAGGLERLVRKELRAAVDQLSGAELSDGAIHQARKHIKKARAVLQLVGRDVDAGRALKRLRRAGQQLGPLRDADAVIDSGKALCVSQRRTLSAKTCTDLDALLRQEKRRLLKVARHDRVGKRAAALLKHVQRAAKDWDWNKVHFASLADDIARAYKRARRAMRQARSDHQAETFHTWRKRTKTLWYALRLLEDRLGPADRRLSELARIQTWLGDDHNLTVLCSQVETSSAANRPGAERAQVVHLARRRQDHLHRMALKVGARLFKDSPKAFARYLQQRHRSRHSKRTRR